MKLKISQQEFAVQKSPNPLDVINRYFEADPATQQSVVLHKGSITIKPFISIIDCPEEFLVKDQQGRQHIDLEFAALTASSTKQPVITTCTVFDNRSEQDSSRIIIAYPDQDGARILFLQQYGLFTRQRQAIWSKFDQKSPTFEKDCVRPLQFFAGSDEYPFHFGIDCPGVMGKMSELMGHKVTSTSFSLDFGDEYWSGDVLSIRPNSVSAKLLNDYNQRLDFASHIVPTYKPVFDLEEYTSMTQRKLINIACLGAPNYLHDASFKHTMSMTFPASNQFALNLLDYFDSDVVTDRDKGLRLHYLHHIIGDFINKYSRQAESQNQELVTKKRDDCIEFLQSNLYGFKINRSSKKVIENFVDNFGLEYQAYMST